MEPLFQFFLLGHVLADQGLILCLLLSLRVKLSLYFLELVDLLLQIAVLLLQVLDCLPQILQLQLRLHAVGLLRLQLLLQVSHTRCQRLRLAAQPFASISQLAVGSRQLRTLTLLPL